MKHTPVLLLSFLLLCADHSRAAEDAGSIQGIWVGRLSIPHGPTLRLGVRIANAGSDHLAGTLTIVEQSTGEIPCDRATFKDGRLLLVLQKLGIEIEVTGNFPTEKMEGEFRQRGGRFPIVLNRAGELPALRRPQEPKPPFPYHTEQVEYTNRHAAVKLAGTFTFPKTGGPFPAVLILSGSGPQNRDGEFLGHKPFLVLADYLTRRGVAVLRTDDRGVAGSSGDFRTASTSDFAEDALAGVAYLKTRKEAGKIGLLGHSEGGMTAPLAASRCADAEFVVMMAGPGAGFERAMVHQICEQMRLQGASEEDIQLQRQWRERLYGPFKKGMKAPEIEAEMRRLHAALSEDERKRLNWPEARMDAEVKRSLTPWWLFALSHDPAATLRKVSCPMLAINGGKDRQNLAQENLPAIEAALRKSSHKDFLVKELPGLNHFFQTCETGSESEYGEIEETLSPAALELIAAWILEHSNK